MVSRDVVDDCLKKCRDLLLSKKSYFMLPTIIECLENMSSALDNDYWDTRNTKLGTGLGRLVMEDFSFSESELGSRLMEIANAWSRKES